MRNPYNTFIQNIKSVEELHAIHQAVSAQCPALDLDEILRAVHVLTVSAFDCYIHDVVQKHMHRLVLETTDVMSLPKECQKFKITVKDLKMYMNCSTEEEKSELLLTSMKKALSEFSFESSQTVEKALSCIGIRSIWSKIAGAMNLGAEDVKKQLNMIVLRRNCIAHQADISSFMDMKKNDITHEDVSFTIDYIKRLTKSINDVVDSELR